MWLNNLGLRLFQYKTLWSNGTTLRSSGADIKRDRNRFHKEKGEFKATEAMFNPRQGFLVETSRPIKRMVGSVANGPSPSQMIQLQEHHPRCRLDMLSEPTSIEWFHRRFTPCGSYTLATLCCQSRAENTTGGAWNCGGEMD
jgi:hypothetical protein